MCVPCSHIWLLVLLRSGWGTGEHCGSGVWAPSQSLSPQPSPGHPWQPSRPHPASSLCRHWHLHQEHLSQGSLAFPRDTQSRAKRPPQVEELVLEPCDPIHNPAAPQGPPGHAQAPPAQALAAAGPLGWGRLRVAIREEGWGPWARPLQLSRPRICHPPSSPRHQEQRAASLRSASATSTGSPWLTRSPASGVSGQQVHAAHVEAHPWRAAPGRSRRGAERSPSPGAPTAARPGASPHSRSPEGGPWQNGPRLAHAESALPDRIAGSAGRP